MEITYSEFMNNRETVYMFELKSRKGESLQPRYFTTVSAGQIFAERYQLVVACVHERPTIPSEWEALFN